ncbi:hypothetical protein CABS01_06064 [Colletotrichum abscissum]|uniref:AB hydrolase-1 domain-containing protein n=1 Tax=Colletotrichum abscissum TaxID=1671311 RepID=A0A9Q0B2N6_9PEZI|nr:uncharacterized protein CABS01_06064 [Colletotrichum abscissum]KAI3546731.1 hypothetical protein CABS02_08924 [Colletotrichum abscissum]KAK1518530.1 hypothetical protein CABS01_06064 [Colletotrichum abscissum]
MTTVTSRRLQISPSITYEYYVAKTSKFHLPNLLFLHGFPSTATDFRQQLEHFASLGYGVIAPDLLGYGGTSKPHDPQEYTWRKMSTHIKTILDAENFHTVVGVGHDLGSWFLSRLYHFYPSQFGGLVFLDVGYSVPGEKFDVEMINRMTKEMTGEERFRYWDFFTDDEGVALMDRNVEAVISLMHASPEVMAANLGPPGKARDWVSSARIAPAHSLSDRNARENSYFQGKVAIFKEGGWAGPTNWYKALRNNLSYEDEKNMIKELEVPVLLVGCGRDEMTVASFQDQMTSPWAKAGYRFEVLETGHWVMIEDTDAVTHLLQDFVSRLK